MNSPVILKELLKIDKNSVTSVYIQLAQKIIHSIQRGDLKNKEKLPGTRSLSTLLGLHRNTVVAAYEELALQGWIEIVPNKGAFVMLNNSSKKLKFSINKQSPKQSNFTFTRSRNLEIIPVTHTCKYVINEGTVDYRIADLLHHSKWYQSVLKRRKLIHNWAEYHSFSEKNLSKEICNYINQSRGMHINNDQLSVTDHIEMSLHYVSQLMFQSGDLVITEELSSPNFNKIIQQTGAVMKTASTDELGICTEFIKKNFILKKIKAIVCTSNRQYPTTHSLAPQRRIDLMEMAKNNGIAIIEIDYDYEWQLDGAHKMPLVSSDALGNVIYISKIGASLLPEFQKSMIIAPNNVTQEIKNLMEAISPTQNVLMEQALAEIIHEGELHRTLKKSIVAYKKRRNLMNEQLQIHFSDFLKWTSPTGGLAFWLDVIPPISLVQWSIYAAEEDVFIPKNIMYQSSTFRGIRFGFAHLNETEIPIVTEKLKKAFLKTLSK